MHIVSFTSAPLPGMNMHVEVLYHLLDIEKMLCALVSASLLSKMASLYIRRVSRETINGT